MRWATLDRTRLASLMAGETARLDDTNSRSRAMLERAQGSLLDGVPMHRVVR